MTGFHTFTISRPIMTSGRPETPIVPIERVRPVPPAPIERRRPVGPAVALPPETPFVERAAPENMNLAPVEMAGEYPTAANPPIAPVIHAVSYKTGVRVERLKSERRTGDIVKARQIAFFVIRRFTGRSLPQIGRAFGGRDHTTVLHGCKRVESVVEMCGRPVEDTVEAWIGHLWALDWPRGGKA